MTKQKKSIRVPFREKLTRSRNGLTRAEAKVALEGRFAGIGKIKRGVRIMQLRRGINNNTLNRSPRFYGFLQNIEGVPITKRSMADPASYWYLQFECVAADWVDKRIEQMRGDARLGWITAFLQGRTFTDAWDASTHAGRYALSAVHQQFAADLLTMSPDDGVYECLVDASYLLQAKIARPREAQWFELILVERPDDPVGETHGFFFFDKKADDGASLQAQVQLGRMRRLEDDLQEIFTAINFPNFEPPEQGDLPIVVNLDMPGDAPAEQPDADMAEEAPHQDPHAMFRRRSADPKNGIPWRAMLTVMRKRAEEWLGLAAAELAALAGAAGPYGALAGVGRLRLPAPDRRRQVPAPLAYIGHPGPDTMSAGGAHRPFVGAVNVGQGGLNVISDSGGRIVAYFDFGWTISTAFAPAPGGVVTLPDLCFCDRPTIIISSLDSDHVDMLSEMPDSLGMRWILPQELSSAKATKRIAKITAAGGVAYLFPRGGARRHLRFPWGFVERCSGGASNRGGLAAFVCLEGAAIGAPAAAANAIAAGVAIAAGTIIPASGSASAVCNRGRAAVNAVALLPLPALNPVQTALHTAVLRAVCAALGLCRHANAMDPGGTLFAGAVRAAVRHAVTHPGAAQATLAGLLPAAPFDELAAAPMAATRTATAAAIHAVMLAAAAGGVPLPRAQSNAAAAAFVQLRAAGIQAHEWAAMVWMARHPAWAPAGAPRLVTGIPPYHASERFVMLCGDAFCWDVPSLNDIPPPAVVGMQAGHHGSIQSDGGYLTTDGMPWAPGSPHSAAARAAAAAPANVVSQAAAAGHALNPALTVPALIALINPAVTAVVNGLLDTYADADHATRLNADRMLCLRAVFTAAAAVISTTALASYRRRGAGAILAGVAHPDACNPGSFLLAVTGPLGKGAAITLGDLAATGLLHQTICKRAATVLQSRPGAGANTIAEARATATALMQPMTIDHTLCIDTMENCLSRRLTGAAPIHPGRRLAAIASGFAGYPATRAQTLQMAALHTAAGVVAHRLNLPAETVLAALEPINARAAAVAAALPNTALGHSVQAGQIAYSYGVTRVAPFKHGYASISVQFGKIGHAHPAAVRLYESHGWVHRFNTSADAHQNAVQGDAASPKGNVALCWDAANHTRYGGHYTGGAVVTQARTCAICGAQMTFNC